MARGHRREPVFETSPGAGSLDVRLSHEDRAGGAMPKVRGQRSGDGGREPPRGRLKKRRRPILARAFYSVVVLGLWGVIGLAAIIAYHAAQLPPIDQLAVPKRPPNIAILASDGTLLANRGETGGGGRRPEELPPFLPPALLAPPDRRARQH